VLVYELTSEPVIDEAESWYTGELGGYTFVQRIAKHIAGRDPGALARRWARLLRDAIRSRDRRHLIGLGMLPDVSGPLGAANVANVLDVLLVHEYPEEGKAKEAVDVVRSFAAHGKPVIVGETAPLMGGPRSWRSFLCGSRRYVDGYLSFYDGRTPSQAATTPASTWYADMLAEFLRLRAPLMA
jgi:hypothetical protein